MACPNTPAKKPGYRISRIGIPEGCTVKARRPLGILSDFEHIDCRAGDARTIDGI